MIKRKENRLSENLLFQRITYAEEGDVLHVKSFVNECKSLVEFSQLVEQAKEKGVELRSKTEPWFNVQLWDNSLGLLSQLNQEIILDQSAKGRKKALDEGKKLGRRRGIHPKTEKAVLAAIEIFRREKDVTVRSVCARVGISTNTYYSLRYQFE